MRVRLKKATAVPKPQNNSFSKIFLYNLNEVTLQTLGANMEPGRPGASRMPSRKLRTFVFWSAPNPLISQAADGGLAPHQHVSCG